MTGFVAVGILSDKSRNIWRRLCSQITFDNKERIELFDKWLFASEDLNQAGNIVRNKPNILPSIALCIIVLSMNGLKRIERLTEFAFAVEPAHKLGVFVEIEIFVRLTAFQEVLIICRLAQFFGQLCHTSISQSIFQPLGHTLVFEITRQITILFERSKPPLVFHSRMFGCFKHLFFIYIVPFEGNIYQYGDAGISYHTIGFIANKMPNG